LPEIYESQANTGGKTYAYYIDIISHLSAKIHSNNENHKSAQNPNLNEKNLHIAQYAGKSIKDKNVLNVRF